MDEGQRHALEEEETEIYHLSIKTYTNVRQHIIDRPDTYGGSKQLMTRNERVLVTKDDGDRDRENEKDTNQHIIKNQSVQYTPISRRVFYEILDNLKDAATIARQKNLPLGKQEVILSPHRISVYNESAYIPIEERVTQVDTGRWNDKRIKRVVTLCLFW